MTLPIQPTINLGLVGHVDHGKTTLTKLLSGKWTDTHSEEVKRGITIKLGYTNFTVYKKDNQFSTKKEGEELRKFSIVDAPGHESFMATMISGAAVMDYALLLVAANEKCPQPQTIEHLKTLEIAGIKNIIVVQNKIDLITEEEAIENFNQINQFLSTTIYKEAPIIPISAEYGANLSALLEVIMSIFEEPQRELEAKPLMNVVRSFDINKPGDSYENLKGGILGGSIIRGKFKIGDEIEIKPGLLVTKEGKQVNIPISAKIEALRSDKDSLDEAVPGGSIAIMTKLDPFLTKSDALVGQIAGPKDSLGDPSTSFSFEHHLFDKVITSEGEMEVKALLPNEPLMMIVNSFTTVGLVSKVNPKVAQVKLKRPVMAYQDDRVVIFRRFGGNKWRIIGYGFIQEE